MCCLTAFLLCPALKQQQQNKKCHQMARHPSSKEIALDSRPNPDGSRIASANDAKGAKTEVCARERVCVCDYWDS